MDLILLWLTRILLFLMGCVVALFSSCKGMSIKLYSQDEILSILSERYGTEFVIVEKIKTDEFDTEQTVKSRFYAAAPADEPDSVFWVYDEISRYSGLFLPSYGHSSLEDTYAHDCFLRGFDALARERGLDFIYRIGKKNVKVSNHLTGRHLQGGSFCFFINRDNAESIVTEVFEICGKLKKEYPLQNNPEFFLTISFHDESEEAVDGKWLFGGAYFSPFRPDDFTGEYATADSVLKEIYEKLYLPSE